MNFTFGNLIPVRCLWDYRFAEAVFIEFISNSIWEFHRLVVVI